MVTYMLSILLPCRYLTVVFDALISFLQPVSYSERTHSLHCYLHAVYSLTLSYLHCRIRCLISFLQLVSYSEYTHSLHCYYMLSILLPCRTFTVVFDALISFLQPVSYSERTHSLHCYLHAVYSLILSYLNCRIRCFNFIPSAGKLF